MKPRPHVHVVVDARDDIGTVNAIYALQNRERDVLVVPIMPTAKSGKAVAYEILRILDEREPELAGQTMHINWENVRRRLVTGGVYRLILLYAHNIEPTVAPEVADELAGIELTAILVYLGWETRARSTFALEDLLAGQRPPPSSTKEERPAPWPEVPDVHPLRFRYDCRWQLPEADFEQIDRELRGAYTRICRWIDLHPYALDEQIAEALARQLRHGDQHLLKIRRSAAWLAMIATSRGEMPTRYRDTTRSESAATHPELPRWLRRLDLDGDWRHAHDIEVPIVDATWPYATARPQTLSEVLRVLLHTTRTAIAEKLVRPGIKRAVDELTDAGMLLHQDERISATRLAMYSAYRTHEAPFTSPTSNGTKPGSARPEEPEAVEGATDKRANLFADIA